MEAGTTALHPVAAEVATPDAAGALRAPDLPHAPLPATGELAPTLWVVAVIAGLFAAAGMALDHAAASVVAFVLAGGAAAIALALARAIVVLTPPALRRSPLQARRRARVAVVGSTGAAAELARAATDGVDVVGAITPHGDGGGDPLELGTLHDLGALVVGHRLDVLLIGRDAPRAQVVDAVLRQCEGQDVRVCDLAAFAEDLFGCVPILEADASWLQCVFHPRYRKQRSKRIFDVSVAALLAVLCLPLLGALALLVCRDGGPALYRQRRLGRDGRPFVIYKLRTMRCRREDGPACWAEDGDPRITRLGRVLRQTHLDELPQLYNVLRGEMTLVGPRPEQPEIAARLDAALPLWRGRHRHQPGLTGWAQVRCGYGGSDDGSALKLAHDLYYLRRRSLAFDVAILAHTAVTLVAPGRCPRPLTTAYVLGPVADSSGPAEGAPPVPAWESPA